MRASVITRVALMAALTAVGAQLTVPVSPVPFTLQVPVVVLSGLLLGARYGALAQIVYLVMGAIGIPVFAGFSATDALFGPTGGYLLSYPLAAAVAGLAAGTVARAARGRAVAAGTASGIAALAVIYALGVVWLGVYLSLPPVAALAQGVLPFIPFDVVKIVLAALVAAAVAPQISSPGSPARVR